MEWSCSSSSFWRYELVSWSVFRSNLGTRLSILATSGSSEALPDYGRRGHGEPDFLAQGCDTSDVSKHGRSTRRGGASLTPKPENHLPGCCWVGVTRHHWCPRGAHHRPCARAPSLLPAPRRTARCIPTTRAPTGPRSRRRRGADGRAHGATDSQTAEFAGGDTLRKQRVGDAGGRHRRCGVLMRYR